MSASGQIKQMIILVAFGLGTVGDWRTIVGAAQNGVFSDFQAGFGLAENGRIRTPKDGCGYGLDRHGVRPGFGHGDDSVCAYGSRQEGAVTLSLE
jgi:hypothetical protein